MDPKVCGKLLTHHRRGYGVDVEALRDGCPLRRSSGTGPRWDLVGTESCGGGIWFLAPSDHLRVRRYIYRRKEYVGGAPRGPRGRGRALGGWAHPHPRGAHVAPPTYFFLLYIPTYPQTTRYGAKNIIPPPQPSVPVRSHLGAFSGAPPEGH